MLLAFAQAVLGPRAALLDDGGLGLENVSVDSRCEVFPALTEVDSCNGLPQSACNRHFVARKQSLSRCLFDGTICTEGDQLRGCLPHVHARAHGRQLGELIQSCMKELALDLWAAKPRFDIMGVNSTRYNTRTQFVRASFVRVLGKWFASLGYQGALTCAMFQTLPLWPNADVITRYNAVIFNTFVCPMLRQGARPPSQPAGLLRFACCSSCGENACSWCAWPGVAQSPRVSQQWNARSLTRYGSITSTTAPVPAANISTMLGHIRGCADPPHVSGLRRGQLPGMVHALYQARPEATETEQHHDLVGIAHTHLPVDTCHVIRGPAVEEFTLPPIWPSMHLGLLRYFKASDPTNEGSHSLLHEFGEYVAHRWMNDDAALNRAWELFLVYYVSPAPMHAFLWEVMSHRDDVGGVPIIPWLVGWCTNYRIASALLGQPARSDAHAFLYAECAHGTGHGSVRRMQAGKPIDCNELAEAAARAPQAPSYASALWRTACERGQVHDRANQQTDTPLESTCRFCNDLYRANTIKKT